MKTKPPAGNLLPPLVHSLLYQKLEWVYLQGCLASELLAYFAEFFICRYMASTVSVIHNTNTRRISPSIPSFMLYNLCVEKPHTCNFSSGFNGNWFSLMLKYPPCPCYFHSELNFLASSCSLSYYMCMRERGRWKREKKEHLRRGVCECLYESTQVSATVNKSHGQPELGTMVSP